MATKKCVDCLYCKVSAMSTEKCRLCFCSVSETKERREEFYWLTKKACESFNDMNEKTSPMVIIPAIAVTKRHPLVRNRYI